MEDLVLNAIDVILEALARRSLIIKAFYLIFRNPQLAILTCPQLKVHALT